MLAPASPRDPDFLDRAGRPRAGLRPGRGLRRAGPARRARACPRTAGSTCTSRCCPPGAGPRRSQHAVLAGDDVTGATTFRLEEGLDTGPVYGVVTDADRGHATPPATCSAGSPTAGARLLVATLDGIEDGTLVAGPAAGPTACRTPPSSRRADARVDWSAPGAARRPAGPRDHAGAGRVDRRCGASGSGSVRSASRARRRGGERLDPGELPPARRGSWSAPAAAPVRLGEVRPHGRRAMPPPTGPAACGWARGSGSTRDTGDGGWAARRPARPYRRPRPDPPRRAAFDLLRAVDERDAYANLVLPGACCASAGSPVATPRSPPSSRTARCAGAATYDAVLAALRRPAAGLRSTRRCSTCCGWARTSCSACACPTTRRSAATVELARAVAGEGRASFVNAVLRRVARHDLAGVARRGRPGPRRRTRPGTWPWPRRTHAGSSTRCTTGCGSWTQTEAMLRADDEPPQVTLVARPGRTDVADAARRRRRAGSVVAVRRGLPAGDPADAASWSAPARPVSRTRAASWPRSRWRARRDRRCRDRRWLDLCAGPGGKAALLAGLAAERGAALLALEPPAAPGPAWSSHALAGGAAAGWRTGVRGRGRARGTVAAGSLRPGAGRRPVHRAGRAAPPARGAVAPPARATWPRSRRCSAGCCTRRWTRSAPAGWSPT